MTMVGVNIEKGGFYSFVIKLGKKAGGITMIMEAMVVVP